MADKRNREYYEKIKIEMIDPKEITFSAMSNDGEYEIAAGVYDVDERGRSSFAVTYSDTKGINYKKNKKKDNPNRKDKEMEL